MLAVRSLASVSHLKVCRMLSFGDSQRETCHPEGDGGAHQQHPWSYLEGRPQ